MAIGIDSFVASVSDAGTRVAPEVRMRDLLDEMALADEVGLHAFGIGEHHREEFLDSAPAVILAAAAGRGSFIESFPLFGLKLEDYDSLFEEKLELLLQLREQTYVHWSGKHRSAL